MKQQTSFNDTSIDNNDARENALVICRKALIQTAADPRENPAEKKAALFYLTTLKDYSEKLLHHQSGFGRGIGGTGDNMVFMPLVERENGEVLLDKNGKLQTTKCVFDDFQTYLQFIQTRREVQHGMEYRRFLPGDVNALPVNDYMAIWHRQNGRCDYSYE